VSNRKTAKALNPSEPPSPLTMLLPRRTGRRDLLALAIVAALRPCTSSAQQAGRIYRLGFVAQQPHAGYAVLLAELGRLGFVEGRNLLVDPRGFGLSVEQLEATAVEVARAQPDAIFAGGDAAARAAQRATATIPIVTIADDVIRNRLASSLARPAGNLTGISILASELNGKRLELLTEIVPGISHMAALVDPGTTTSEQLRLLIAAAHSRGVELSIHQVETRQEIVPAIEAARASGAQALNVFASALLNVNRKLIIEHSALMRLPAIYQFPEHCADGGLAGYGSRLSLLFRHAAGMLAKVMAGARPADLPVEQPIILELCLNMQTAKALGLTVPQSILARADEVIE
jgi:putative ABC transport system substrate-binding protein